MHIPFHATVFESSGEGWLYEPAAGHDRFDDDDADAFAPQIQQAMQHRSRFACADGDSVDLCHLSGGA